MSGNTYGVAAWNSTTAGWSWINQLPMSAAEAITQAIAVDRTDAPPAGGTVRLAWEIGASFPVPPAKP